MFGRAELIQRNNLEVVELKSHDLQHRVEIYLHGATVASWIKNDAEKLFLSSKAIFDGVKALRGGIPLVFPQFSRPDLSMPQHGFLRTSKWTFLGALSSDDSITAYLHLGRDQVDTSWPFQFDAVYEVTLTSEFLQYSLRVFNPDNRDFPFQALLHTYLRVPVIEDVRVQGLQSWQYHDKVDENKLKREDASFIVIDREVDRIYVADSSSTGSGSATIVDIQLQETRLVSSESIASIQSFDASLLSLIMNRDLKALDATLRGTGRGRSYTTDVVVWNAWEEKAKALDDLDDDAYFHYICIEPGLVSSTQFLRPNEYVTLTQKIF